jgi:glycerol dehydrogenase-like iron-containing ADH family enzyme
LPLGVGDGAALLRAALDVHQAQDERREDELHRHAHLAEQHEIQQKIQKLEKQQRRQRQEIFQVEDSIIEKRDALIETLERRLTQKTESERLFTIEWTVV